MSSISKSPRSGARFAVSELLIGIALLALAAVIVIDALNLPPGPLYGVGPAAAPMIVAGGLLLLGLGTVIASWRSSAAAESVDVASVLVILGGLTALIALIGLGGGFIAAFTVMFAATAWAFGSRAPHVDVAIGFVLSLVIYLAFTRLLALSLPQGPLERLL